MTDDSYPEGWSTEPPHPDDPILGDNLRPWRPSPAMRAAVAELAIAYTGREHHFGAEFLEFGADQYEHKSWPQAFLALLEMFHSTATGSQGQDLTMGRLYGDLDAAHDKMHGGL